MVRGASARLIWKRTDGPGSFGSVGLETDVLGIVEPSMEEQPQRSVRLEMGQSSSGVHTAGTNRRLVVMTLQDVKVSPQSGGSGPKTPVVEKKKKKGGLTSKLVLTLPGVNATNYGDVHVDPSESSLPPTRRWRGASMQIWKIRTSPAQVEISLPLTRVLTGPQPHILHVARCSERSSYLSLSKAVPVLALLSTSSEPNTMGDPNSSLCWPSLAGGLDTKRGGSSGSS
ncbi:hypothetical protein KSP39_PZI003745 [Platanthera zijinensis]|uniref:Uncharacterized protein n=1 Tax=Platanthera zijinensis TaxID=2320716 RepID=A0AAP0BXV4_9ASPA